MALLQHSVTASFSSLLPGKALVIRRPANSGYSLKLPEKLCVAPRYLNYRHTACCQHPLDTCESLAPKEKSVVIRRDGNFHQAVWDDQFIASLTTYDEWEDQCKGYMQEARWFYHSHVPGMDEYLKVGSSTSCGFVLFVITAIGMGEMVTKEALDYIIGGTKLPWLLSLVIRITDDLGTSKDEHDRGDVAKIVQCYMKDQGVSEEVAREHIKNWNEEIWKEINQEILKPLPLPKPLIKGMVNLARLCETFYLNGNDGLGNSQRWSVDLVNSLFFDPIKM